MSHSKNYGDCDLAGHNPRYWNKSHGICLYCGKLLPYIEMTEREVSIVDYYSRNITKDKWYHDFVTNEKGKEMRVLDKKYFNFKGWR